MYKILECEDNLWDDMKGGIPYYVLVMPKRQSSLLFPYTVINNFGIAIGFDKGSGLHIAFGRFK